MLGFVLALGGGAGRVLADAGSFNQDMARMAEASPLYRRARQEVEHNVMALRDPLLARESREALLEPGSCIRHRVGQAAAEQEAIVERLKAAGFLPLPCRWSPPTPACSPAGRRGWALSASALAGADGGRWEQSFAS
jgi:hypothetical protein